MMIRSVLLNAGIHFVMVVLSTAASEKTVKLELTTTGCEHNCVIYEKKKCFSSIKINGVEFSHKEDGFNVVIYDNESGEIKTDYFRWFKRKSAYRWRTFRDFFTKINTSSTVIVVLQNMCANFDKKWYRFLSDSSKILISHKDLYRYDTAILVGCKLACPRVVQGSIPYNYYGVSDKYTKNITFTIPEKVALNGVTATQKSDGNENIGSLLGGIIAVVFIACLAAILYVSYKRQVNWTKYIVCLHRNNIDDENQVMFDGQSNVIAGRSNYLQAAPNLTSDRPEYAPLYDIKSAQSNEHIYEYINPRKCREAENEYYKISSICTIAGRNTIPEVSDHRQMNTSNMMDTGAVYEQPVDELHPASSRNDEMWYESPDGYRGGNFRDSQQI